MDETYETPYGIINIYYRKAKVLLDKIALYEDFDDLKESYDMLILNEYDQVETAKTLKKYKGKCVVYHGPYYASFNKRYNAYNKMYDILYLNTIKKAKPIIFTKSKLAMEYLASKGLEVRDYLGVGLDVTQLEQTVEEENPVEGKINEEDINILYIGKLEERRNIIFMLECLKELIKHDNKYKLIMVGNGSEDYKKNVQSYIETNNLSKHVLHIERLEQKFLPRLYECCRLFLLPTSYEIWGMVLMEAMLYKLPVITTFNGGSSSLIRDGVNGRIVDELDVKEWTQAIIETKYDADTLKEYNDEMINEKCNWGSIAERMLVAFEKR